MAGCLRLTRPPTAPASGAVGSLSPTCRTEMSSLRFRAVRPARCRVANFTAQIAKPCRAGLAPGITWQASGKASTTRARACTAAAARVRVSSAKTRQPRPRSDSLPSAAWDCLRPSIPGWCLARPSMTVAQLTISLRRRCAGRASRGAWCHARPWPTAVLAGRRAPALPGPNPFRCLTPPRRLAPLPLPRGACPRRPWPAPLPPLGALAPAS